MNWSSSTGNPLVYWTLYILLVGLLTYCGWGISYKDNKYFYRYAWIAGIFYSLIEGLRWLRGADYYAHYMDIETNLNSPGIADQDPKPLYELWVHAFNLTGLPTFVSFIFYSAILIWAYLLILKHYPKSAIWALPIFFLLTNNSTENIIRQYLAISFLLFAYVAYLEDKKILMYTMLGCVPLIHLSGFYGIALFLFATKVKMPFNKPWLFLGIYFFAYFFWNPDWFQGFSELLQKIHIGNEISGQNYLINSERWFTSAGSIATILGNEQSAKSSLSISVFFLIDLITIYFGFLACKDDLKLQPVFYLAFISLIIRTIAGDIELLIRFSDWTYFMVPFMIGLMFYHAPMNKNVRMVVFMIFAIRFLFYALVRALVTLPYAGCGFLWDR